MAPQKHWINKALNRMRIADCKSRNVLIEIKEVKTSTEFLKGFR